MVHKNTIKFILKNGGFEKIVRATYFFVNDKIKRTNINFKKNKLILGKYEFQTIKNDQGISTELQIYESHEPLTTHLIINELKQDMVCIDLGSNIGYYAVIESNIIGESGKIFAIEPSPINFPILKLNLENQKKNNFVAYNIGIGDKNEEMEFIISAKSNWSRIRMNNEKINSEDKVIKIPVKTLNSFVNENDIKKIDILRMDVEGFEYSILLGANEVLEKFKPKLFIEIHKMYLGKEKTYQIFNELKNKKYEIKYYIPRIYDSPIIGKLKDIKKITIDEILNKLKNNTLPDTFQVMLEYAKN
jgi:FkbM family methyltransferase|tara:strand:+ start:187 stop:1095 length:909 start_codon:yes stop_codon:yes gene_type:complete